MGSFVILFYFKRNNRIRDKFAEIVRQRGLVKHDYQVNKLFSCVKWIFFQENLRIYVEIVCKVNDQHVVFRLKYDQNIRVNVHHREVRHHHG